MAENIHIYQEEKTNEHINMRQEAKPITLKVILKQSNFKTIKKVEDKEADVNFRRGSNPLLV